MSEQSSALGEEFAMKLFLLCDEYKKQGLNTAEIVGTIESYKFFILTKARERSEK